MNKLNNAIIALVPCFDLRSKNKYYENMLSRFFYISRLFKTRGDDIPACNSSVKSWKLAANTQPYAWPGSIRRPYCPASGPQKLYPT